ncbi:MAG: hypothetical protein WBD41_07975 [Rhodococcus sp. (in: high G+C Gram-positive bacteria)]
MIARRSGIGRYKLRHLTVLVVPAAFVVWVAGMAVAEVAGDVLRWAL